MTQTSEVPYEAKAGMEFHKHYIYSLVYMKVEVSTSKPMAGGGGGGGGGGERDWEGFKPYANPIPIMDCNFQLG